MTLAQKSAWSARWPISIGVLGLVLLLGGFGSWAAFTNIAGAVIANGRIEVDQNRQVVQHPDGGVVSEILVDEGEMVAADQPLLRLDATTLKSKLVITENELYELMARRGRLEAERDGNAQASFDPLLVQAARDNADVRGLIEGQKRLLAARAGNLTNEIAQLTKRKSQIADQIKGIVAQQDALREQTDLIGSELSDQQSLLDKGLAQASRVLSLRREQAGLQGSLGDLTAQKAQSEGRMTEIDIELLKLQSGLREETNTTLQDLQYRELELREQRSSLLEQIDRLDIVAPVSGVVYGLQVFAPRSVLKPAEPILYIVPQDRPLVIHAQVVPSHIDQIRIGQDVRVRFSALDRRTTPELTGKVVQISADAFQDEGSKASYYRVEITLSETERDRLPDDVTLIPGMPVEVFIRTQDRTPLAYLIKPLSDYFARAFRG
ncbi:HlyD family type I secretion periplasmic adaptor subunit [uncultured Thioclava sp.]|uniref:HlyD family type I secretion periplasmic adaptor subunit n=1 Tax=uncultured Thioclava sp. TaxID=473858 RepID=UPI0025E79B07|nr:HlyD family type I secretion periplasmic adaptor subunit [uncultured Thioclava sp.]